MEKSKQEQFTKKVQNEQSMKLGGDPSTSTLNDWSKTVPNNPIVTKFSVAFLPDLLTTARFPNDTQITGKALLISSLLRNCIKSPLFCWNNCSDNGTCKCNDGHTEMDCSDSIVEAPKGTICGWARGLWTGPCLTEIKEVILCDGLNPQVNCPSGYGQAQINLERRANYLTCYKLRTDSYPGKNATLCGSPFSKCGGMIPSMEGCPVGYKYSETFSLCYKTNLDQQDALGTWCGYGRYVTSLVSFRILCQILSKSY